MFVTDRSDEVATSVLTVTLLLPAFGSLVVELTVSVSVNTVPDAIVEGTLTTRVKAVVVVPTFMEVLDTTIAVVALRYIAGGL